jgi:hypothetical protein
MCQKKPSENKYAVIVGDPEQFLDINAGNVKQAGHDEAVRVNEVLKSSYETQLLLGPSAGFAYFCSLLKKLNGARVIHLATKNIMDCQVRARGPTPHKG